MIHGISFLPNSKTIRGRTLKIARTFTLSLVYQIYKNDNPSSANSKSATGRLGSWNLIHPIAALLIDEFRSLKLKRIRCREGRHLRKQCVAALGIGQEVGAHQVLREPVHRVTSVVVVDQPALHHPAQSMYVAALQREVLI